MIVVIGVIMSRAVSATREAGVKPVIVVDPTPHMFLKNSRTNSRWFASFNGDSSTCTWTSNLSALLSSGEMFKTNLCHVHRDDNELLGILLDEGTDSHVESKSRLPTKGQSVKDDRAALSFGFIGKAFKIDDEKTQQFSSYNTLEDSLCICLLTRRMAVSSP